MRKSIVHKVFLSTMGIFFVALLIQLFIQLNFIDDIHHLIKANEMEKAFEEFTEHYLEDDINEETREYFENENAPLVILDAQYKILNKQFFEQLNYIEVQTESGLYKVLLLDRIDEAGVLKSEFIEYAKGNKIKLSGGLFFDNNIVLLDNYMNNPLVEEIVELQGLIVAQHFLIKEDGIYSNQSQKILRELSHGLLKGDLSMNNEFYETETGLIITILSSPLKDNIRAYTLYTTEDLSETFTILNLFYIVFFVFQMGLLVCMTFLYSKWITKPIKTLIRRAKEIANLDFGKVETIQTGDELEDLSNSLESISDNMSHNIDLLKKDALEKAESEKKMRELLANLSHEFKTPLSIMSGFVEMLEVSDDNKDYYTKTLMEEIEKLNALTKETLLLCESESQSIYKLEEVHDLKTICDTDRFTPRVLDLGLTLDNKVASNLVQCDGKKIQLVVDNLISNAINYTESGERILLYTEETSEEIILYVENTGVTLNGETLERLFDKYYRHEKSRNKDFGGTGLGLAIVRNILEAHGSRYRVFNKDNSVVFSFSLKKYEG